MLEENQTEKLLKCNKCGEWKPCGAFSKDRNSKREYQLKCKQCDKKYRESNAENIKLYKKKYRERNKEKVEKWRKENSEHLKLYNKKYKKENSENIKQYWNTSFKAGSKTNILKEIKIYELYIVDSDNDINFQCAYCGKYFKTTKVQIQRRLRAINGHYSDGAEHRLYCSEQCKHECPVYKQITYSKDHKPATSREVQPQLRQMVLKRDNYTCQKCNKHKDELEVGLHCHHFYPYFRSWDLWGGLPANLAAIELMKQYCAESIGVGNGEIIASSKGLHLYDYIFEIAEIVRGRSVKEFAKEIS